MSNYFASPFDNNKKWWYLAESDFFVHQLLPYISMTRFSLIISCFQLLVPITLSCFPNPFFELVWPTPECSWKTCKNYSRRLLPPASKYLIMVRFGCLRLRVSYSLQTPPPKCPRAICIFNNFGSESPAYSPLVADVFPRCARAKPDTQFFPPVWLLFVNYSEGDA